MDPTRRRGMGAVFAEATDPDRMRAVVERHLRLEGAAPVEVTACQVAFARHGESRSLFQYQVTLRDPAGGDDRREEISGVAYGGERTRKAWSRIEGEVSGPAADGSPLARAAYVPDLDLLLQVFPFDHHLPALAPLVAGPWPPLVAPLLARFGEGDWRLEGWDTKVVRYRVDLRACVRLAVRATEAATGRTAERRFYVKTHADQDVTRRLWEGQQRFVAALAATDEPLVIPPVAAYLPDEGVVAQDEASGVFLVDLLADPREAVEAARRTGRAVAALHRLAVAAPPAKHELDRMGPDRARRSAARLRAARPDLGEDVDAVEAGILAGLDAIGDLPAIPIHGDLKPVHVLLDGERVVLLDFDKSAAGEPMLDVTSLARSLRRRGQGQSDDVAGAFVGAYLAHAPAAWERRLAPHYAAALLTEAAAIGKSVRSLGKGDASNRRAKQANQADLLVEEARAVLAGRVFWRPNGANGHGEAPPEPEDSALGVAGAERPVPAEGMRMDEAAEVQAEDERGARGSGERGAGGRGERRERGAGGREGRRERGTEGRGERGAGRRGERRENAAAGPDRVRTDAILAHLAEDPDLGALRAAFPGLTEDDLRAAFTQARDLALQTKTVRFKKGATQTVVARTHGLPEPDPAIHKGNIFRLLVGLLKPGRMLDLGAGKGNFSLSAAELGWDVTAVDARTVRWPDLEAEADPQQAALIRGIRWVQADVREFPIEPGAYDLICVLGLLHHLEVPDQVALLKRCSAVPTLLDTRIAKANIDREGAYEGMLIREHGETREERDEVPQASWGNPVSFQHTEDSLLRLVRDCGYIKMMQMRPPHRQDYTFYLCLPAPSGEQRPGRRAERQARREQRRSEGGGGADRRS